MSFDSSKCPKCKGKKIFHIADRVAFAGDKSHFSLGGLADQAKHKGLRVQGVSDDLVALISTANAKTSSSVKNARARKIRIMNVAEFESAIKKICEGNVPIESNPPLAKRIATGGKVFAWGLSPEQEKILIGYLKRNGLTRGMVRKESLCLAVTTSLFINSGSAKILKSLGVPVYDFSRIKKSLLS